MEERRRSEGRVLMVSKGQHPRIATGIGSGHQFSSIVLTRTQDIRQSSPARGQHCGTAFGGAHQLSSAPLTGALHVRQSSPAEDQQISGLDQSLLLGHASLHMGLFLLTHMHDIAVRADHQKIARAAKKSWQ